MGRPYVRMRADGRWQAFVNEGVDAVSGREIRRSHILGGGMDELQALAAAEEWFATPSVACACAQWLESLASAHRTGRRTMRRYEQACRVHLLPCLGHRAVDEVTPAHVAALRSGMLERGLSPNTVRLTMVAWELLFSWCIDPAGYISDNPVSRVDKPRRVRGRGRALDVEEVRALVSWADGVLSHAGVCQDRVVALAIVLGLHTGCRIGEACAIERCDVNHLSMTVTICGSARKEPKGDVIKGETKSHRPRSVPLTPDIYDLVRDHLRLQAQVTGMARNVPLLCLADGEMLDPCRLGNWFRARCRALELDDAVKYHSLRHTFATYALRSGEALDDVQRLLGHASATTTMDEYAHEVPGHTREVMYRYGDLLRRVTSS